MTGGGGTPSGYDVGREPVPATNGGYAQRFGAIAHVYQGNRADAQLIALAPSMAEAILRYSKGGHEHCGLASCGACTFAALAEKLRAIGATDA